MQFHWYDIHLTDSVPHSSTISQSKKDLIAEKNTGYVFLAILKYFNVISEGCQVSHRCQKLKSTKKENEKNVLALFKEITELNRST